MRLGGDSERRLRTVPPAPFAPPTGFCALRAFLTSPFRMRFGRKGELSGTGRGRALTGVSQRLRGREPDWNMATCAEILRSEFPEIDGQVFDYVTGEPNRINALGMPKWKSGRGEVLRQISGGDRR